MPRMVVVVKGNELARLSLADAQAVKWAAGRDKYGETWAGEHPLYEAFSDAIDVLNYLDEAERQGCEVPARVHHDARCLALSIRSLAELRGPD